MSKKRREIPVFDHPIIETHCHLDYLKDLIAGKLKLDIREDTYISKKSVDR